METILSTRIKATRLKHLYSSLKLIGYHYHFILLISLRENFMVLRDPTLPLELKIVRKHVRFPKCDCFLGFFFPETSRSLMLSYCNETIGANEAEDFLTASSPISRPALFEDKLHRLAVGGRWAGARRRTRTTTRALW